MSIASENNFLILPPSINGFLIKSVKAVNGFKRRLNDPLTNLVKSLKIAVYVLINPSANPAASPPNYENNNTILYTSLVCNLIVSERK